MSHRLSMSRMGLARECLYGFRSDVRAMPRPVGRAALVGRLVHAMVEATVNKTAFPDDPDLTLLAEAKAIFDGPLRGFINANEWNVCEKGYRYNTTTDTCVDGPRRGEPGYENVPDPVLPGTLDLVKLHPDLATVVDVKSGKPPTDSDQLCAQAVAISRRFNVKRVRVMYARALKTKLDLLSDEELDEDRLDAEAGRIARYLRVLPNAEPVPGDHCWKCDARPVCPAQPRDEYIPPAPPREPSLVDDDARFF